ncbi:MAG: hypothetical protein WCF85_21310 [Rhodospirillaceae bacterium]
MKSIAYLKARLTEWTSRNVLTACLLSIGGSMAAGVPQCGHVGSEFDFRPVCR